MYLRICNVVRKLPIEHRAEMTRVRTMLGAGITYIKVWGRAIPASILCRLELKTKKQDVRASKLGGVDTQLMLQMPLKICRPISLSSVPSPLGMPELV